MDRLTRKYYSQRKGITNKLNLDKMKELFCLVIKKFCETGFFDDYLGYQCEGGGVSGKSGNDIENYIFLKIRRNIHWPIYDDIPSFDEDTLFDLIEFFHDSISHQIEGYFPNLDSNGWQYDSYNREKGQQLFRDQINVLLNDYANGFFIAENGEIEATHAPGLSELMENDLPSLPGEEQQIKEKVDLAIARFRDRHSSFPERQSAVRELANVLEYIRPLIKESMLTKKDENDLFNIANNFCIRHNGKNQKNDYSIELLCWIFHVYLATIHLCLWARERDMNDETK